MQTFADLPLNPPLLQGLDALGYAQMTPIQAQSLGPVLAGRDVLGQASTGSGKTAAFGLGVLAALDPGTIRLQGLVLCPTRELADQVSKELRALARFIPNVKVLTLCGGIALRPQVASLAHDPHIVVGTPGRIQELLKREDLHAGGVKVFVLDEADRLLDMGFEPAIADIVKHLPKQHQTLLFSATFPAEIRAVSRRLQREPVEVTVDTEAGAQPAIEQRFFEVEPARKTDALLAILAAERPESTLVFCNTRRDVDDVAAELKARGVDALALHGDLDQREREEMLVQFANRSCTVLVASDVAARGLDIKELPAVVSYELATDPDAHRHRIGRTARAGHTGLAIALVSPRELPRVRAIEQAHGEPARWQAVPKARAAAPAKAAMTTLAIDAGRQDKLRPGDILGALTGAAGLPATAVGKIDIFPTRSYVALLRADAERVLERLRREGIKGRRLRVRRI